MTTDSTTATNFSKQFDLAHLLHIDASLQPDKRSVSRQLASYWQQQLAPQSTTHIDLAQVNPPAIDAEFLDALQKQSTEPSHELASHPSSPLVLANQWIQSVQQADALLMSTPMYNFGLPAHLKTFFDYILRAGVTFQYTDKGPEGLLQDKPVFLVLASGGDYRQGPAAALNFLDGHLQTMLNFIGLKELHFVHAAGLAMGADPQQVIADAKADIDRIVLAS